MRLRPHRLDTVICQCGRHSDGRPISLTLNLEKPLVPFFFSSPYFIRVQFISNISRHRTMCGRAHRVGLIHTWAMHTGLEPPPGHTNDVKRVISVQFPWESKKLQGSVECYQDNFTCPHRGWIPYLNHSRDVFQSPCPLRQLKKRYDRNMVNSGAHAVHSTTGIVPGVRSSISRLFHSGIRIPTMVVGPR